MASALNALPTITATALGASLATGIAAGQYKAPTAVVGYTVPMDSLNFYVQARDEFVFSVTSTATGTNSSAKLVNTSHKGLTVFVNAVSVGATCTLGVNILLVDQANTGNALAAFRASMDGITTTTQQMLQIYPGGPTSGGAAGFMGGGQINGVMSVTYQVQVSVTATASAGGANVTYSVSQSKIM